jgi:hypothetical protein
MQRAALGLHFLFWKRHHELVEIGDPFGDRQVGPVVTVVLLEACNPLPISVTLPHADAHVAISFLCLHFLQCAAVVHRHDLDEPGQEVLPVVEDQPCP